jgi:predicted anti-sigma-YlaC factor YlaD
MGGWRRTTACERTRLWLSLALDSEISDLEEAAVRRHVERCTTCAIIAAEFRGITEVLRAEPLDEPRRRFAVPVRCSRRSRLATRRVGFAAAAFAVSVASAVAVISLPSKPELVMPTTSALQFDNGREAAQFAQRKEHALEPFLGVDDAPASPAEVPVFSQRALR